MSKLNTVSAKDLGPDGKLRRKYEIDEEEDPKGRGMIIAKVVVVATIIFAVKEFLSSLWSDRADARAPMTTETVKQDLAEENTDTAQQDALPEPKEAEPSSQSSDNTDQTPDLGLAGQTSRFQEPPQSSFGTDSISEVKSGGGGSNVFPFPVRSKAVRLDQDSISFPNSGVGGSPDGKDDNERVDQPPQEDDGDDGDSSGDDRVNRFPTVSGPLVLSSLYVNQSVIIGLSDLLVGSHDPDGDVLTVEDLTASSGSLQRIADDEWLFTPESFDESSVEFTFRISDGEAMIEQTGHLDLLPIPGSEFIGTDDDDRIVGSAGDDQIDGRLGDDVILGREGDDVIHAGSGNDRLFGDSGNDVIYGSDGDDVIFAGLGSDIVFGGPGNDYISGDEDNDSLFGGTGNDTIRGGPGEDRVSGDTGDDDLDGGADNDTLYGGAGEDLVAGGSGNDVIVAGSDNDVATGGSGDDQFVATSGDGDDDYSGGTGQDTVDYSAISADVSVNLQNGQSVSDETGTDGVAEIENVVTGDGDDTVHGDGSANDIRTGAGEDNISGAAGDDVIVAGADDDVADGGAGDDQFVATPDDGDDAYSGGAGTDTYDSSATSADTSVDLQNGQSVSVETGTDQITEIENVVTGDGDDTVYGDGSANVIHTGAGDDIIVASGGDDEIDGGEGNDLIDAGDGNDYAHGGHGDDTFKASDDDDDDHYNACYGSDTYDVSGTSDGAVINLDNGFASSDAFGFDHLEGFENVIGSTGNDIITANDEVNTFVGNGGDDIFIFIEPNKSGSGGHIRDRIEDFEVGDKIDVSAMDGDSDLDGIQKLTFHYSDAAFTGVGQIQIRYEDADSGTTTLLRFNFDDDDFDDDDWDASDFEIEIIGRHDINDQNLIT